MAFAGCDGHEDRVAVDNATAENSMKDASPDLARARDLPRHELRVLYQGSLFVAQTDDV